MLNEIATHIHKLITEKPSENRSAPFVREEQVILAFFPALDSRLDLPGGLEIDNPLGDEWMVPPPILSYQLR